MCFSLRLLHLGALLFGLLFSGAPAPGQTAPLIEVEHVRFQSLRDQWLRTEIRLRALENRGAANSRFVSNIHVVLIMSFQRRDGEFIFYRSQAKLVGLEKNQRAALAFYLPGLMVKRDDLREPFAYLVEVEAEGHPQPFGRSTISENIRDNPQAIASLKRRALEAAARHDGILLPSYLAPPEVRQLVLHRERPVFRRLEGEF